MVEEKTSKKKQLILAGIGLAFLLVLVIGATYAYFQFTSQNDFKDPATIEGSMGELGAGVTLTKAEDTTLTLNLSAADMLLENAQTYYASGSETPKTIATVKVAGAGYYNCTYTLEVTKSATSPETDMYERFTKHNPLGTNRFNQIWFTINDRKYDFLTQNLFDADGKLTYTESLEFVSNAEDVELTANMVIVNESYVDQTYLNGTDISLSINATEFNCDLVSEIPKVTNVEQLSIGADGVQVRVNTSYVDGIDKYYYSVNGSEYVESEYNSYTFTGLEANKAQEVSVYVTNILGNESKVSTNTYNTRRLLSESCSGRTLSDCLLNNGALSLQTDYSVEDDDLYRFVGNQGNIGVNNYICLGTDSCKNVDFTTIEEIDASYRIIGINPETKELKVIKNLQYLGQNYEMFFKWNDTGAYEPFVESDLYTEMNSVWFENISFGNLIVEHTWNIGAIPLELYFNGAFDAGLFEKNDVIKYEQSVKSPSPFKVGIKSLTDYYLAHSDEQNWYNNSNYINNWLAMANSINGDTTEWVMTTIELAPTLEGTPIRNGSTFYYADGSMNNISSYARPTFFLTSELQYVSGEGTVDSPFIVELAA